jgi:hypothetical protein
MEEFKNQLEYFLKTEKLVYAPSQDKLSIPLVFRIFTKMMCGLRNFDAIRVADDIIIDGHHRYIASKLSKTEIQIFPSTKNHNQLVFKWEEIILNPNEYDSDIEINYHNFNDATKNGISLEEIEKILKK